MLCTKGTCTCRIKKLQKLDFEVWFVVYRISEQDFAIKSHENKVGNPWDSRQDIREEEVLVNSHSAALKLSAVKIHVRK